MMAATFLAIFVVPVLFFVITRYAYGKEKLAELQTKIPKVDYDHDGEGFAH
jgi:HAE1 family hydrophobic/amphiphilic exporter-1